MGKKTEARSGRSTDYNLANWYKYWKGEQTMVWAGWTSTQGACQWVQMEHWEEKAARCWMEKEQRGVSRRNSRRVEFRRSRKPPAESKTDCVSLSSSVFPLCLCNMLYYQIKSAECECHCARCDYAGDWLCVTLFNLSSWWCWTISFKCISSFPASCFTARLSSSMSQTFFLQMDGTHAYCLPWF